MSSPPDQKIDASSLTSPIAWTLIPLTIAALNEALMRLEPEGVAELRKAGAPVYADFI